MSEAATAGARAHGGGTAALTLGAIGIVYGDIGTSPLYALRESLRTAAGDGITRGEVLGVVSLLLWALILIVTLKYVIVLLRADNDGEGGVLSLMALAQAASGRRTVAVFVLGVAGAALFFGDALITPAISVLSAVEGLELVTPAVEPYVLPIAIGLLVALFAVQRHGTGAVAAFFGPITAIWFVTMGMTGLIHVADDPSVLAAFNPAYGIAFLTEHGFVGVLVLGAVFLAVTGAEALYADLGHFGRKPIRIAWFVLVFPALALNYLGQGALVLADPEALRNPFFLLVPAWALPPLVVLATLATLIASQAVITGAYSLTRQAIQLGLLPRLDIRHTSERLTGQIYMPLVNTLLLVGVVALVLLFGSSSSLAAAYGIAVSGTMLVTTALAAIVLRARRRWPVPLVVAAIAPLAIIECGFLIANGLKFGDGGYVPILVAAAVGVVMVTWSTGTRFIMESVRRSTVPLGEFVRTIEAKSSCATVPGTAVFLTSDPAATPPALLHNLKHNHVLHGRVLIVTVRTIDVPRIVDGERVRIVPVSERFTRVELSFGYMETPDVRLGLRIAANLGLPYDEARTTFFLSRRKLVADGTLGMPLWQDRLFMGLAGMAADPSEYYNLPRERVVELGTQMAI